jgi:serine/threonine protein kinase
LGAGSYGSVHKSIDLDSGHFIAVKVVRPASDPERMYLDREIAALQALNHVGLLYLPSYIISTLLCHSILQTTPKENEQPFIRERTHQMLSALDYLSSKELCHRDVKPSNILFDKIDRRYNFQLADFGLANHQKHAKTWCGTRVYMAPELQHGHGLGKYPQTPKMDIWSLFVTIASLISGTKFDEKRLACGNYTEILAYAKFAADDFIPGYEPMARENPRLRASAAQMLVRRFGGKGLTTDESEMEPLM